MKPFAQPEFTPVFDWTPSRGRKLSLISFIVGSALLHAFCFYVFQVIYPPPIALLPPPARVTLITPNSEEGRVLLRWIEAEDPALSSTTQRPPGATELQPPKPAHVPSYARHRPPLKEPPPYERDLRVPSPQPPGPVPIPRAAAPADPAPPVATTIQFHDTENTGTPEIPPLEFNASTTEPPHAAQYRVAIAARGAVRHALLEVSSGDRALDDQARRYILLSRFRANESALPAADDSLTWITATVEWGSDLTPRPPATAESPAP